MESVMFIFTCPWKYTTKIALCLYTEFYWKKNLRNSRYRWNCFM